LGEVIEYRSPREREEFTAYVGMLVFLAGWSLLFVGVLMAYTLLRLRLQAWPPPNQPELPARAAALLTGTLLASTGFVHRGYRVLLAGRQRDATAWVGGAAALGIAFFVGQAWIWRWLAERGLSLTSSPFGALFYLLSGLHLAHVLVGLIALLWLWRRLQLGLTNPARHMALRLWGLYWYFVGSTWAVLFVAVYLV
jgi:cytochrome c oxidase subunit 3